MQPRNSAVSAILEYVRAEREASPRGSVLICAGFALLIALFCIAIPMLDPAMPAELQIQCFGFAFLCFLTVPAILSVE